MNARLLILGVALVLAMTAGGYHWKTIHLRSRLEAERVGRLNAASEQRRLNDEISRQLERARSELAAQLADRLQRSAMAASSGVGSSVAGSTPTPRTNSAAAPPSPELRRLQTQAFVSEQRLRFSSLLTRLGFTAEKLQAFDRIQEASQHVRLDPSQSDALRQQAWATRDAQLKDLFGAHHELWLDANRTQPARAVVDQIVQQTFQSSGALTTAQAEELTRIVDQRRIRASHGAGARQPGYDWDRIISDADSILADRQREDFVAAVEYRRASEKMSAMAAKRK